MPSRGFVVALVGAHIPVCGPCVPLGFLLSGSLRGRPRDQNFLPMPLRHPVLSVVFRQGWLHGEVDALDSHEQGVDRQHSSERSSTGNYVPIREGWSRRHRGAFLAWRTEPQRCEIHCREVSTEVRVNWKVLRVMVGQIFDAIDKAAANMS